MVKSELGQKLLIYELVYITVSYGNEIWTMTKRKRSLIKLVEINFLYRLVGTSLGIR